MTRPLLLALALARAVALLDSPETPGLRGTISEAAEPAGQYYAHRLPAAAGVRGLPGRLLHELLRQVPRGGLHRGLLPGRKRRLRPDEGQLFRWKRVLDDGDRAAVPRRDRSSQRPKGAVQLLSPPVRARNKLAGRLFSLPLVHSD
jgi:hypothetical protein